MIINVSHYIRFMKVGGGGGGGGQSRVLGFWESKGAVCVRQCIFSNSEGALQI